MTVVLSEKELFRTYILYTYGTLYAYDFVQYVQYIRTTYSTKEKNLSHGSTTTTNDDDGSRHVASCKTPSTIIISREQVSITNQGFSFSSLDRWVAP
jgi:hypothetical protein